MARVLHTITMDAGSNTLPLLLLKTRTIIGKIKTEPRSMIIAFYKPRPRLYIRTPILTMKFLSFHTCMHTLYIVYLEISVMPGPWVNRARRHPFREVHCPRWGSTPLVLSTMTWNLRSNNSINFLLMRLWSSCFVYDHFRVLQLLPNSLPYHRPFKY